MTNEKWKIVPYRLLPFVTAALFVFDEAGLLGPAAGAA
jgi:hypothetical protein